MRIPTTTKCARIDEWLPNTTREAQESMSIAMHRLLSGVAAMRIAAPAQSALVRSVSTQANVLPANLTMAEEKPTRAPRVIPAAQEASVLPNGDVSIKMLSLNGDQEGNAITLDGSVFGAPTRVDILQRVVRWQLACRRAGTNKTKTRSEVSGSTRKPWKQKGSGRARVGDIR